MGAEVTTGQAKSIGATEGLVAKIATSYTRRSSWIVASRSPLSNVHQGRAAPSSVSNARESFIAQGIHWFYVSGPQAGNQTCSNRPEQQEEWYRQVGC
jgi:hypothetical protein